MAICNNRTAAGILLTSMLAGYAAHAADVVNSSTLDEIVVTAQKRAGTVQDTPFSVSATSQEQIRNSGAGNITDFARNVAGLTIADLGPGQSQVAIRGISSGQVIRDQPGVSEQVGVYLDESPISVALFTPDLELFDLDRMEVLRGPQGTLFGAGSEAGTIRYITAQPKLGVLEGLADASAELPKSGSVGGSGRLAVNLPMGDTAAVRIVVYEHHLPGFIDSIQPNGSIKKDVNDGDRAGIRVSMLWKPTEQLSITPRVVYQNLTTNGYPREDAYNILGNPYMTTQPKVTIGERQQYTQQREGIDDDFGLADFKIDYDFGPATLTSISSYTRRRVTVLRDATQLTGSVSFDVGIPEVRVSSPLFDRTRLNVTSEELRLSSNGKSTIDWLVGGFFQHVGRHYGQDLPTPGYDSFNAAAGFPLGPNPVGLVDTPFFSDIGYRLKQYAGFGEATWHLTDQLGLTGGLRYYKYSEARVQSFNGVFDGNGPQGVQGSVDSHGVSPRGILSFKLDEDAQFNAQVSKGFRLGGINDPINKPLCSPEDLVEFGGQGNWKDETSKNYELDAKFRFLDRKVTLNIGAFYTDIHNLQATVTAGTCSSRLVFNVPKAQSHGIEAELFARPNSTWDFGLSATWVNATLRSSVVSTNTVGGVTTTNVIGGLADGNRLPTAPQVQAVGSIGYTLPIQNQRDFFSVFTVQYVGSSYSQFENEEPGFGQIGGGASDPNAARLITYGGVPSSTVISFDARLPAYSLGNLRAGVRNDVWEVAAYLNNLWDTNAHLALDYERGRSARVGYITNQPRTIGVYARYKF
ncbi:MAG TPA: TonB-dependent receptor [Steroidobacteraceae bacterium]|jgi:iron complex outermembrane receptor protein|nr:TonB-dependent receptor [Steroidobacteraceae bacterium]